MKTIMPKQIKGNDRKWYIIDAEGQTLGRMSTQIAMLLKGKNKPDFAPHVDNGDYVIVINADKFKVTGNKLEDKMYYRHTGYLG
jgi:large subunit ribosomal protein L13